VKVEVVKPGFINFFFDEHYFNKNVESILRDPSEYSKSNIFSGKKIFFEHSQPNPFKAFHIGHLMGNCIGESVSRIIKANGAETQVASYHGDVGLQVAKSVWAMKNGISLDESYAYGHKAYEDDEKSKAEIIEINKKIYDESDVEISKIYEQGRKESLENFDAIYKRLDSEFDFHFFESESGEIGAELVRENMGSVFEEGENGAVIFKGENFEPKTHIRVFLNSEGLPTYEAKELGLAQIKKDFFEYDKSITVTANEQDSFFKVVEVAIGEVFPELKGKLKHLSHGMLKLPSGKMSSRTGTVISAESLIDQVKEKVKEKIDDEIVSEIIAIGAIKYSILRQAIGGDIIFDFDKSISFEGDSGPYLQYATVRANSILKKSEGVVSVSEKLPENWQTTNIERLIERFPSVVERAGSDYAPHHIVTYLIELSGEFNSFYASHKIIDEGDITSPYRLAITKAFVQVMTSGLTLLGIKVPERM
ncbi:MAG: arginine--tRNA ligase, partial [Nitrospira sp.]